VFPSGVMARVELNATVAALIPASAPNSTLRRIGSAGEATRHGKQKCVANLIKARL
jgi:hypothetical protein